MKDLKDLVVCFVDFGVFQSLAERFGGECKKVYYYTPHEWEFLDVQKCIAGDGIDTITRMDDWFEPEIFEEIDLFVFPDIGYGGLQRLLVKLGKAVWGSKGADELELYRTRFLKTIKDLGLPMIHAEKLTGLTALADHLKKHEDKFVKINRYRANMETWHHRDWTHSQRELERLSLELGPFKEKVIFVVQDNIPTDIEIGYDGFVIDGELPEFSFQGPELKNKCYLGSMVAAEDLPEQIKLVNDKFVPTLREWKYRAFYSTEIRVKDDIGYFIDPTLRTPGLCGEHQWVNCRNICEVIWHGANGIMTQPDYEFPYVGAVSIHYTGPCEAWKTIVLPKSAEPYAKLYRYACADDALHFPPDKLTELGVIACGAPTIEGVIDKLAGLAEDMKDEPVDIEIANFAPLLAKIIEGEKEGVEFGEGKIPAPAAALEAGGS